MFKNFYFFKITFLRIDTVRYILKINPTRIDRVFFKIKKFNFNKNIVEFIKKSRFLINSELKNLDFVNIKTRTFKKNSAYKKIQPLQSS